MRHPPLLNSPTTVTSFRRDCDGTHTSHLFESLRMALRASPHHRVRLPCRLCLRAHNVSATGLDHNCLRMLHPTDALSTAHCTPHCNAASLTASDCRAMPVSGLDHNCSRILHQTKTNAQPHTACVPHCNATSLTQVRNAGAPVRHARACLCSCRVTPVAGGRSCWRHQVRLSREACVCVHVKMFICASA
jgi:hypothetical protein